MTPPQEKHTFLHLRDYRDPHTELGLDFAPFSASTSSSFLLHECGLRRYENWNHRGIRSPYWRVHYNYEPGNAIRVAEGRRRPREFPLEPDSLLLIPEDLSFDTIGRLAVPHLWIHFTPLQSFVLSVGEPVRVDATATLTGPLKLLRELYDDTPGTEGARRLLHLSKAVLHLAFAGLDTSAYQRYPARLYALLEWIEEELGTDLSTARLAQRAGLSQDRLSALFKKHLGQSPSRYITNVRLRHATRLLTLSDLSIEQIAEDIGYPNRYYFSRVFKKHLGCGPAAFRKGQRKS